MHKDKAFHKESGNAAIIVLVVLVVVAIGALAYMSGKTMKKDDDAPTANKEETAQADEPQVVIKPGNPVVATVDGKNITRMEVFNFIQTLPPNARQTPVNKLFPAALEEVVNAYIIEEKTKNVNLDSDAEVKRELAEAKKNIVRNVYVQKQVEQKITDARLKEAYEQYKANFPAVEEVKARHILVKDKDTAKDLLKQLDDGADFAKLAGENSIDGTKETGGDLGYFTKSDVVPEFGDVAFSLSPGERVKTPLKTDFGYHIIEIQDKRQRPPASYEEAKPYLEAQLRQLALTEIIRDWRKGSNIERFDINGEAIKPAADATENKAE